MNEECDVQHFEKELTDDEIGSPKVRRILVHLGRGIKKLFFVDNKNTLISQVNYHLNTEPALSELLNQSYPVFQEYNPKFGKWVDLSNEENMGDGAVARVIFLPKIEEENDADRIKRECDNEQKMENMFNINKRERGDSLCDSKQKMKNDEPRMIKRERDGSLCDSEQKNKLQHVLTGSTERNSSVLSISSLFSNNSNISTVPVRVSERPVQNNTQTMRNKKRQAQNTRPLITVNNTLVRRETITSGSCQRLRVQKNNRNILVPRENYMNPNAWATNRNEQASQYPPPYHFSWAPPYPTPNLYEFAPPGWRKENYVWVNKKNANQTWCRNNYVWVNNVRKNPAYNCNSDSDKKPSASDNVLNPMVSTSNLSKQISWDGSEICEAERIERLTWGKINCDIYWQNVLFFDIMGFVVKQKRIHMQTNYHPYEVKFIACITQNGVKEISTISKEQNGIKTINFLNNKILDYVLEHNKQNKKPLTITTLNELQSNFKSKAVRKFRRNHNLILLGWPNCARNIYPLAYVWKHLAGKIKDTPCNSCEDIISIINKAWEVDTEINLMCGKFIESLPQIINCMVEQEGNDPKITIDW